VDKFKARIVAKGFLQREGVDFEHTFTPTPAQQIFKMIVAIGAMLGMNSPVIDVSETFLHTEVKEDIYFELPRLKKLRKLIFN
jgi:hypothetical protein